VFEFESSGIAGTPFVKMVELNSIAYEEFCKKCEPPAAVCPKPTLSLSPTQTQITATVTNGPGTIVMMPGNVSLLGSGPFVFKKLEEDTQYSFTFKNDCGESVSGVTETLEATVTPCPVPTMNLVAANTQITATVTNGPGTITLMPGNLSLSGNGPFVFKKLKNDTQYALTFVSNCGSSVSGTAETDPAVIPPVEEVVVYCASQALPGGGFYYHYADSRDPTATVEFTDCNGAILGYVHSTPGPGHTVKITSCCPDQVTLGWGVNRSNCNVEPNMVEIYQALCLTAKPDCGCSTTEPLVTTDLSVTSEQSFFVTSPSTTPAVGSSGTVTFKIRNVGNNSDASKFFWSFPSGLNVTSVSVSYIGGANGMSLYTAQSGQTNVNLPDGGGADVVFSVTAATTGAKVVNGNVTTPLTDTNSSNNSTQQTVTVI
jgi:hypothetical protein